MFLLYVLSFFKKEDTIQGGTLFKGTLSKEIRYLWFLPVNMDKPLDYKNKFTFFVIKTEFVQKKIGKFPTIQSGNTNSWIFHSLLFRQDFIFAIFFREFALVKTGRKLAIFIQNLLASSTSVKRLVNLSKVAIK